MHLTGESLQFCFIIIKWQLTLLAAATLKWNVFSKVGGGGHILEASVKAKESLERVDTRTHILGVMLAPNFFTPKGQLLFTFFYFIDILSDSLGIQKH